MSRVKHIPPQCFSVALGLSGLCGLMMDWHHSVLAWVFGLLSGVFFLMGLHHGVTHFKTLHQETRSIPLLTAYQTGLMTAVNLSVFLPHKAFSVWLWYVFVVLSLLETMRFVWIHFRDVRTLKNIIPQYFVVAGGSLGVCAVANGTNHYGSHGWNTFVFYWMAIVLSIIALVLLWRLKQSPLALEDTPNIAIYGAAPALTLAAAFACFARPPIGVAIVCLVVSQGGLLWTWWHLPRWLTMPKSFGYASFTFPHAIGARMLYRFTETYPTGVFYDVLHVASAIESIIATFVISAVCGLFFYLIFIKEKKPA